MLENRELSIRVNRKDAGNKGVPTSDVAIFEDKASMVDKVVKDTIHTIFVGICMYVAVDTFRQVLVARNRR